VAYAAFESDAVMSADGRQFTQTVARARGELAWLRQLHDLLRRMAPTELVVRKRDYLARVIERVAAEQEDDQLVRWLLETEELPTEPYRLGDSEIPDPAVRHQLLRAWAGDPPANRMEPTWRRVMDDVRRLHDYCAARRPAVPGAPPGHR
jgi:hypothetical protein